jgi:hypothetical protein
MNENDPCRGRPHSDHLALRIAGVTAFPDPRRYRQGLPGPIWRRWQFGEIGDRAEFWHELERLWGTERVLDFIARRRAA